MRHPEHSSGAGPGHHVHSATPAQQGRVLTLVDAPDLLSIPAASYPESLGWESRASVVLDDDTFSMLEGDWASDNLRCLQELSTTLAQMQFDAGAMDIAERAQGALADREGEEAAAAAHHVSAEETRRRVHAMLQGAGEAEAAAASLQADTASDGSDISGNGLLSVVQLESRCEQQAQRIAELERQLAAASSRQPAEHRAAGNHAGARGADAQSALSQLQMRSAWNAWAHSQRSRRKDNEIKQLNNDLYVVQAQLDATQGDLKLSRETLAAVQAKHADIDAALASDAIARGTEAKVQLLEHQLQLEIAQVMSVQSQLNTEQRQRQEAETRLAHEQAQREEVTRRLKESEAMTQYSVKQQRKLMRDIVELKERLASAPSASACTRTTSDAAPALPSMPSLDQLDQAIKEAEGEVRQMQASVRTSHGGGSEPLPHAHRVRAVVSAAEPDVDQHTGPRGDRGGAERANEPSCSAAQRDQDGRMHAIEQEVHAAQRDQDGKMHAIEQEVQQLRAALRRSQQLQSSSNDPRRSASTASTQATPAGRLADTRSGDRPVGSGPQAAASTTGRGPSASNVSQADAKAAEEGPTQGQAALSRRLQATSSVLSKRVQVMQRMQQGIVKVVAAKLGLSEDLVQLDGAALMSAAHRGDQRVTLNLLPQEDGSHLLTTRAPGPETPAVPTFVVPGAMLARLMHAQQETTALQQVDRLLRAHQGSLDEVQKLSEQVAFLKARLQEAQIESRESRLEQQKVEAHLRAVQHENAAHNARIRSIAGAPGAASNSRLLEIQSLQQHVKVLERMNGELEARNAFLVDRCKARKGSVAKAGTVRPGALGGSKAGSSAGSAADSLTASEHSLMLRSETPASPSASKHGSAPLSPDALSALVLGPFGAMRKLSRSFGAHQARLSNVMKEAKDEAEKLQASLGALARRYPEAAVAEDSCAGHIRTLTALSGTAHASAANCLEIMQVIDTIRKESHVALGPPASPRLAPSAPLRQGLS